MAEPLQRVELRTKRLVLRPLRLEDVDDVFAYAADREWARYLPEVPHPYVRRHAEEFVARTVLTSWETNPTFAIVLDSRVIGGINLRVDVQNETGEIGYSIGRRYWGQGLMTETAQAVVDWAFAEIALEKVFAKADLRNVGSQRVMKKLGMKREGVLRSHTKVPEERTDEVYYGILRQEWERRE